MQKSTKPIPSHVAGFLDWLDIEKGLASKSQENYARFLKPFVDWLQEKNLTKLKPHQLTPSHVWSYRVYLARQRQARTKRPLKKSTQNYYLIALRQLLNYFANRDIVALRAEKVPLAKDRAEREVRFLTIEALNKLLSTPNTATIRGLRDRAILETFFSTGVRISELTSLRRVQIRSKLNAKEAEISIIGKGGRIRTVYLSERAIEWLKKYLDMRRDNLDGLFPLTPRAIQKMIKKYAILAGIPLFTTPHVMRHTFATDLLEQGVDLRTIQEFLGHKNITATQIYAHVTSKKLREVHKKFHSGNRLS